MFFLVCISLFLIFSLFFLMFFFSVVKEFVLREVKGFSFFFGFGLPGG